jgi:hypothetical protein
MPKLMYTFQPFDDAHDHALRSQSLLSFFHSDEEYVSPASCEVRAINL